MAKHLLSALSALLLFSILFSNTVIAHNQALEHYQQGLKLYAGSGADTHQGYAGAYKAFGHSARLGYGPAQYRLGLLYFFGHGVKRDYSQAHHWFDLAAQQSIAGSHHHLATLYQHGHGVARNPHQAIFWYSRSIENGYRESLDPLAQIYLNNLQLNSDNTDLLTEHADAGDVSAQYNLAYSYYIGSKGEQNFNKAAGWFLKAAALGDTDSQIMLTKMYQQGQGVKQSNYQCLLWGTVATNSLANNNLAIPDSTLELDSEITDLISGCKQALNDAERERAMQKALELLD